MLRPTDTIKHFTVFIGQDNAGIVPVHQAFLIRNIVSVVRIGSNRRDNQESHNRRTDQQRFFRFRQPGKPFPATFELALSAPWP